MIHLDLTGTHYEMGRKLGSFFKEQNIMFPIKLNKWLEIRGIESLRLLEKYMPDVAAEIQGITDVIGYNYNIFGAWMMSMGCYLTLHKNQNIEIRGCTALCFTNNNKIFYGRDNDLPPYLKESSKSIYYRPDGKMNFLMNTSSFTNGEEGINESGLVVAMIFVASHKTEIMVGINSVFIVRYILENCTSVKQRIEMLYRLPIASSCNILLADKTNEMVVVECSPTEINIRYPEVNCNGEKFIVTVNHFTSSKMRKYDRSNQNVYSSKIRYETAYNALLERNYEDAISFAKDILMGKFGFMCQYKNVKFETIWSTIFDIVDFKMFLSNGNPQYQQYQEYNLTF